MIKVKLRPEQGIKVKTTPAQSPDVKLKTVYLYDADWIPEINKAVEDAKESADNAKVSEQNAAQSASDADADATNAAESATIAYNSEQNAIAQANKATEEANAAAESAYQAQTSALAAHEYASNAEADAQNALETLGHVLEAETNATNAATTATEQAGIATEKATEAGTHATNAGVSATNAKTSEDNAKNYELGAKGYSETATQEANASAESAYQSQQSALASAQYASDAESDAQNALETLGHVLESETVSTNAANTATQKAQEAAESAADAQESAEEAQRIKDSLGNVYVFKGSVATFDDLPTVGNEIGDVYNIIDTDKNYAWDGEKWDDIGGTVDLSDYALKTDVPTKTSELENDSGFITADDIGGGSLEDIAVAGEGITFTKPIVANHIASADINGSPTISTEGIITNMSSSNYLKLDGDSISGWSGSLFSGNYSWAWTIKFKTSSDTTQGQTIFTLGSSLSNYNLWCSVSGAQGTQGKPEMGIHLSDNSWSNESLHQQGTTVLKNDTWYYVRLSRDVSTNTYKLELSEDGSLWDTEISFTSSLGLYNSNATLFLSTPSEYDLTGLNFTSNYGSGINWTAYEYSDDKTKISTTALVNSATSDSAIIIKSKDGNERIVANDAVLRATGKSVAIGTSSSYSYYDVVIGQDVSSSANSANHHNVVIGNGSKATDFYSVAIGYKASAKGGVAIGDYAKTVSSPAVAIGGVCNSWNSIALLGTAGSQAIALGSGANASGEKSIAIGSSWAESQPSGQPYAKATAENSIQIGPGTNSTANTMNVGLSSSLNVQLLDADGKIPAERLPDTHATKEYVDTTEQEIIQNFMDADTALQTQITGLSGVLAEEQNKIEAIEGKIPTNASSSNLLSTASDLLNATQDVRADFAEADSELQTQINGQATAIADLNSKKYGSDLSYSSDKLQLLDQNGSPLGGSVEIKARAETDGLTINENTSGQIQVVAVIDSNASFPIKIWTGTKEEYDAIGTKDNNTIYNVPDDIKDRSENDYIIEYKKPTSEDNTWYRIYHSGWIEQGGVAQGTIASGNAYFNVSFAKPFSVLPVITAKYLATQGNGYEVLSDARVDGFTFEARSASNNFQTNNKGLMWTACGLGG